MAEESLRLRYLLKGQRLGEKYKIAINSKHLRGVNGNLNGNKSGSSTDFLDYRDYQPGDDLRKLDWGIFGRSEKEVIKLFHNEVAPKVDIILDTTASMALPETRKEEAVLAAVALLATAAENGNCRPKLWLWSDRFLETETTSSISSINRYLNDFGKSQKTLLQSPIVGRDLRHGSIRIFIGDLLSPDDPKMMIKRLSGGSKSLFIVQILSREEISPSTDFETMLCDVESGERQDIYINEQIIKEYKTTLKTLQDGWNRAAKAMGAQFQTLSEDEILDSPRLRKLEEIGLLEPLWGIR